MTVEVGAPRWGRVLSLRRRLYGRFAAKHGGGVGLGVDDIGMQGQNLWWSHLQGKCLGPLPAGGTDKRPPEAP